MPRIRSTPDVADRLERTLAAIRDQVREVGAAEGRIAELAEQAVRIARGTQNVSEAAAFAVLSVDLTGRIEAALKVAGPANALTLARDLRAPSAHVATSLRALRRKGAITNIGTNTDPLWCWRVGDETETSDVMRAVDGILRVKAMSLQELIAATGVRRNRLSGVLVRLQRDGVPMKNLGDGRRAVWWIDSRKE